MYKPLYDLPAHQLEVGHHLHIAGASHTVEAIEVFSQYRTLMLKSDLIPNAPRVHMTVKSSYVFPTVYIEID